jgi:hypothetical protein
MNEFDMEQAFLGRQNVLNATLTAGRTVAYHPTAIGDNAELNWIKMLREFLPTRYGVSCAFVVDSDGHASEQIDVVVHDRHFSPLLFQDEGGIYITAESVYAVFEVKQDLDKGNLEYAGKKVASVRNLHRTSADIPHAGGVYAPKEPHEIIGGLLTLGSTWSPCMGDSFEAAITSTEPDRQLDLGCSLTCGAFERLDLVGDVVIEKCDESKALIFFALRLFRRLQAVASVPAIDIGLYGKEGLC